MQPVLDLLQWPAMVATISAAWLVAANSPRRRHTGFWIYVFSNVLWVAWGASSQAWAVVALQFCLFAMNMRGLKKTHDRMEA